MIIENVKNPVYANAENTLIDCDVKFSTINDYIPFTASPDDPMEYGRQLYAQLVAGDWGPIAPYVPPPAPPVVEQVGPNVIA